MNIRHKLLYLIVTMNFACGRDVILSSSLSSQDEGPDCAIGSMTMNGQGIHLTSCDGSLANLRPVLQIQQTWYRPQASDCLVQDDLLTCSLADFGLLSVKIGKNSIDLSFQAEVDLTIQAIGLEGDLDLVTRAQAWLSHGFQSWSQTGVIGLQKEPSARRLQEALTTTGEDEVYRKGQEISWWYSFIGSDQQALLAGVSTANRFKSWIQASRAKPESLVKLRLISGGLERISLSAGLSLQGETWHVFLGNELQAMMEDYGQKISRQGRSKPNAVPVGWNSWYDLWDDVKPEDILANAALVGEVLTPRLPASQEKIHIVLDDGWQQTWGDWLPNKKFPLGIDGLAKKLKQQGYDMGLWLAPLLVAPNSSIAKNHPEWLVKGANYTHPINGRFSILDVTHPGAAAHLVEVMQRIVSWGPNLIKIDFLFAATLEGTRHQDATGMEAYHLAMALMRKAVGDRVQLLAVGAPPLASMEYADVWRVGGDIAFKPALFGLPRPSFSFIANQARSIAGRQPFCLAFLCDGDPALLRSLGRDAVEAGAWVSYAAGGALFLSDDLSRLARDRWTWGLDSNKIQVATSGQPAALQSYFPDRIPHSLVNMKDELFTAEHDVPNVWLMPNGQRVAINFSGRSITIEGQVVAARSSQLLP